MKEVKDFFINNSVSYIILNFDQFDKNDLNKLLTIYKSKVLNESKNIDWVQSELDILDAFMDLYDKTELLERIDEIAFNEIIMDISTFNDLWYEFFWILQMKVFSLTEDFYWHNSFKDLAVLKNYYSSYSNAIEENPYMFEKSYVQVSAGYGRWQELKNELDFIFNEIHENKRNIKAYIRSILYKIDSAFNEDYYKRYWNKKYSDLYETYSEISDSLRDCPEDLDLTIDDFLQSYVSPEADSYILMDDIEGINRANELNYFLSSLKQLFDDLFNGQYIFKSTLLNTAPTIPNTVYTKTTININRLTLFFYFYELSNGINYLKNDDSALKDELHSKITDFCQGNAKDNYQKLYQLFSIYYKIDTSKSLKNARNILNKKTLFWMKDADKEKRKKVAIELDTLAKNLRVNIDSEISAFKSNGIESFNPE